MMQKNFAGEYYRNIGYNCFIYLILFTLLWVESSFYAINMISGTKRLFICICIIFIMIFTNLKSRINFSQLASTFFLIIWVVLFDTMMPTATYKQTIIIVIHIFTGFIIAAYVRKEDFIDKYLNIILFLTTFSLIAYAINVFFPAIAYSFPVIISRGSHSYCNLFFSVITNNELVIRNYGLFWEPGAFAFFLCIALYLELIAKNSLRLSRVLLLSVAVLSTKSTMGIVAVGLIYVIFYVNNPFKISAKLQWISLLLAIVIAFSLFVLPETFWKDVFDKLFVKDNSGMTNISTQTRYDAIYYMLKEFLNSFTFGIGIEKFIKLQEEYCNNMATATMINWLATYGLVWGTVNIYEFIKFFLLKKSSILSIVLTIVFSCLLISTENFLMNPFIYVLIQYGLKKEVGDEDTIYCNRKQVG